MAALIGLATAALVARNLAPTREIGRGGRHDYAMALSGFFLRSGRLDKATTLKVLRAAWDTKGWPNERSKREAHRDLDGIVRNTAENLAAGQTVVGGPTLEKLVPGMVQLPCQWWGWEREDRNADVPEEKANSRNQADRLIGYALDDLQGFLVDQHGAPHAVVACEPIPLNSRCYS